MIKTLINTWAKLFGLFPSALPTKDKASLDAYVKDLVDTYNLPYDFHSRRAVLTLILQSDGLKDKLAPNYFAKSIRKAMANQLAYSAIQDLKEEEKVKEILEQAELAEAKRIQDQEAALKSKPEETPPQDAPPVEPSV